MILARYIFLPVAFVLAMASPAFCQGVIGQDMTITVNTIQFLNTGNPDYDAVYNFFLTAQLFVGVLAFYLKLILRVARL